MEEFRRYFDERLLAKGRSDVELRQARIASIVSYLRRLAPRGLVAIDENGAARDYVIAARALGIPTFGIQHGIIHEYHASYMYPRWAHRVALVDRTFVFGSFYKRLLTQRSIYRDDQVCIAGQQRLSHFRRHLSTFDRAALRRRLGLPSDATLLLFASQPILRSYESELDTMFKGAVAERGVHLLVKLHPGEAQDDYYLRLAAKQGFRRERLHVSRDIDLYQAVLSCDRVISVISTVIAEAIVLGAAVGVLDAGEWPDRYGVKHTTLVSVLRDAQAVQHFIRVGTSPESTERASFVREHYDASLERDVSEAIAASIRDCVVTAPLEARAQPKEAAQEANVNR
jgi:hypothetical protein